MRRGCIIEQNMAENVNETGGYVDIFDVDRDLNEITDRYGLKTFDSDDGSFRLKASSVVLDGRFFLVFVKFYDSATGWLAVAAKRADRKNYAEILQIIVAEWKLKAEEYHIHPEAFEEDVIHHP